MWFCELCNEASFIQRRFGPYRVFCASLFTVGAEDELKNHRLVDVLYNVHCSRRPHNGTVMWCVSLGNDLKAVNIILLIRALFVVLSLFTAGILQCLWFSISIPRVFCNTCLVHYEKVVNIDSTEVLRWRSCNFRILFLQTRKTL